MLVHVVDNNKKPQSPGLEALSEGSGLGLQNLEPKPAQAGPWASLTLAIE
jgi:hypothetical protein